jgi:hypothetical protein
MTMFRILGAVLASALASFTVPAQAQFPTLDLQPRYEMIDRDTGRSIGPTSSARPDQRFADCSGRRCNSTDENIRRDRSS